MKKVILYFFCAMCSMVTLAQDSVNSRHTRFIIGVHGGLGPASLIGRENNLGDNIKGFQSRLGHMHGVYFQHQMLPKMALCFEVNYESKGMVMFVTYYYILYNPSLPYYDQMIATPVREVHIKDYVSIPVLAKFKLNKSSQQTEWFVKGGINTAVMVKYSTRIEQSEYHYKMSPGNIDFSYVYGFGVTIPVGKTGVISIEGRDNMSLGNLQHKQGNILLLMAGFAVKL